jgi:hypothetical protein
VIDLAALTAILHRHYHHNEARIGKPNHFYS